MFIFFCSAEEIRYEVIYFPPITSGTRFRWQQLPDGMPASQVWALGDIYIGPSCTHHCRGHGFCFMEKCVCDEGYSGDDCHLFSSDKIIVSSTEYHFLVQRLLTGGTNDGNMTSGSRSSL